MTTRFVKTKTAMVKMDGVGGEESKTQYLIFGDEVELVGPEVKQGAQRISVRGRKGVIDADKLGDGRALEMYFIDVGTGDSTFIVTPAGKKILIDGGMNHRALGFLAWKYRLDETKGPLTIDLLVLTHADDDHLGGLTPLVADRRFEVKRIVHSGVAKYTSGLGDTIKVDKTYYLLTRHSTLDQLDQNDLSPDFRAWHDAIAARKIKNYKAVDSTTGKINIGDPAVEIEVLGPRLVPNPKDPKTSCFLYFENSGAKAINGNSIVLRLNYNEVSLLLPGDINTKAAQHLSLDPKIRPRLGAHIFKAPHHGSHEFDLDFLGYVRPQITVISSGDDRDHGHPRAVFIAAAGKKSRSETPLIFSTEIAARFTDTFDKKENAEADGEETKDLAAHRRLFKRSLHGMINVRTDGSNLYAARRVAASYQWEAYGPLSVAP